MKKIIITIISVGFFNTLQGQNYISKKQHINTINNRYLLNQVNTYFTIKGDSIINTDRRRRKIYEVVLNNEIITKGDKKEKWSYYKNDMGQFVIEYKSRDTFTEKSSKIIYELKRFDKY